tara:strand:- start:997 stop:1125 length:129 start_codon:yes stop_codon:yes gene_type:complete
MNKIVILLLMLSNFTFGQIEKKLALLAIVALLQTIYRNLLVI